MSASVLLFIVFINNRHLLLVYLHYRIIDLLDIFALLQNKSIFSRLLVTSIFGERLTPHNDIVAWVLGGKRTPAACIDLDPCELYESCTVVKNPLKEAI